MKTYKGKFSPKNPQKYKGDPTNIVYRSLWELKVMKYLDGNSNILEWSSEELAIPYVCPTDNRWHRYFPDFIVKARKPDGSIQTMILEVKPKAQTIEPKVQNRRTRKYLTEVMTWGKNSSKWRAATEYCEERKWLFKLITEDNLGIK
jgi:hypothetical protein